MKRLRRLRRFFDEALPSALPEGFPLRYLLASLLLVALLPALLDHSDIVQNWLHHGQGIALLSVWAVTATRASASISIRLGLEFVCEQLRAGPFALRTALPDGA